MEDIKKADTGDFWTDEHTYKTVGISIMNWFISNYAWLRLNSYMLITLIFYGSEHIGQWVKISVTINGSVGYKCICGFGDMLIGSEIPQIGNGPNLHLVESWVSQTETTEEAVSELRSTWATSSKDRPVSSKYLNKSFGYTISINWRSKLFYLVVILCTFSYSKAHTFLVILNTGFSPWADKITAFEVQKLANKFKYFCLP